MGWRSSIEVIVISFFLAAIYSIGLIIKNSIKKEKIVETIPFGPFIVLAGFIAMLVPFNFIISFLGFIK